METKTKGIMETDLAAVFPSQTREFHEKLKHFHEDHKNAGQNSRKFSRDYFHDRSNNAVSTLVQNWPPAENGGLEEKSIVEPLAVQKTFETQNEASIEKCEGYPLDPTKKGLVLHFYQSNDRDGWEEDLKAIEETFGDVLNCEIRNFKDFTDARLLTLLNDLQAEFVTKLKNKERPYNYLVIIVAGHGGWMDPKHVNYFKTANDIKISCKLFEDFFLAGQASFLFVGQPKVIVWNVCRGTKQRKFIVEHPVSLQTDHIPLPEHLIPGRPAYSDYIILYSCEQQEQSFRHPNFGSYLIQLFCEAVKANPRDDLMCLIMRMNRTQVADGKTRAIPRAGNWPGFIQFPFVCNMPYHFYMKN